MFRWTNDKYILNTIFLILRYPSGRRCIRSDTDLDVGRELSFLHITGAFSLRSFLTSDIDEYVNRRPFK